jgi:hypothetical protein
MVNTRIMAMIAVLALVGSAASAIVVPGFVSEVSAQENMTGNMTGNMTDMGGNMTAESGNISTFLSP